MALALASDGLPARVVQDWSFEKLYFIGRYLDIFCTAMKDKWALSYADLLCGPGLCIDETSRQEQKGSPLLAVERTEFSRLFLNDAALNVTQTLTQRTIGQQRDRVMISTDDCNAVVEDCRRFLFPTSTAANTLGLAVIDPTAFQMSYDSIGCLTREIRMDLVIVFMSSYARRFLTTPEFESTLDKVYGTDEWRKLRSLRSSGETVTNRALLDMYEEQLKKLDYLYVDDDTRMLNSKQSTIYHLIFASKHPLGRDFYRRISRIGPRGQRRLL